MVNKAVFITWLGVFLLLAANAQAQWVRSAKTVAFSSANAIASDNTGVVYSAGVMTCITSFGADSLLNSSCVQPDSLTPAIPQLDAFLTKHDQNGNLLWVKQYTGSANNKLSVNDMGLDNAGNCYVTGSYTGTFNTGSTTLANADTTTEFFVMKIRPDGVTDWTVSYSAGSKSELSAKKIALNATGVFVTGYVRGKFQIGAYADSVGNNESFVAAFDLLGNSLWAKNFKEINTTSTSAGNAIDAEGDSVWVFSNFTDSIRVETDTIRSSISVTAPAGILCLYNAAGTLLNKAFITTPFIEGIKFSRADASLYFTGRSENTTTIASHTIFAAAGTRAFVSSHNPDLTVKWVVPINATASVLSGTDIDVNNNGSIVAGGVFNATTIAGPTKTATGNSGQNGFVIKLDPSGNDLWLQTFGGAKDDALLSLSSTDDNHIYAAGYFSQYIRVAGEKIFNTSNNSFNGYIARLDVCPQLVADMLSPDTTRICANDSTQFNVTANAAYTYQWYHNGALISAAGSAALYAHSPGDYTAQISGLGCTKRTPPAQLYIRPVPDHTLSTFDAMENCAGDSVKLTGPPLKLSGNRATNKFYWMDGATPLPVPDTIKTITIRVDGDYYLKITDTLGCYVLSDTFNVRFHPYPLNTISPAPNHYVICTCDSLMLQGDASQPGLTYQWQRDDFPLTNRTQGSFYANVSGIYKVLVSNPTGCSTLSLPDTVVLQTSPLVDLNNETVPTQLCSGQSVRLITPQIIGQTYQWIFNGSDLAGATTNVLDVTNGGQYSVRVKNSSCTKLSDTYTLTVHSLPTASITNNGNATICQDDAYSLSAQANSQYSYQWLRNNQIITGATLSQVAITETGNYSVSVTDQFNCKAVSAQTSVAVNVKPPASITPQGPTTFCDGNSVVLRGNAGTGLSYQWFRDGSLLGSQTLLDLQVTTSGQYELEVTNSNHCKQRSPLMTVNAIPIPVATVATAGGTNAICDHDSLLLMAGSSTSYYYSWMMNGQLLAATSDHVYARSPGLYRVIASVGSCRDTSAAVTLLTRPNPIPIITRDGEFLSIALFGDIQWYRDDVAIPDATLQAIQPVANGRYSVTVINAAGCTARSAYTPMCLPIPQVQKKNDLLTVSIDAAAYRWNYKGIPIGGATQQQIRAQQSGSYSAVVTDRAGCTMETFPVTVCVPYPYITQDPFSGLLKGFPNPASSYQWYLNNEPITDGTTQVNIPAGDGSYTVMVTDLEGCTSMSEPFVIITITGTAPDLPGVRAYPNPVVHYLTLESQRSNEPLSVVVINNAGETIFHEEGVASSRQIDFSGRAAGIYVVVAHQGTVTWQWKIVKH